jgi:hypothetical protein
VTRKLKSPDPPRPAWLTLTEVATATGLTYPQLRRLMRGGHLTYRQVPRTRPMIASTEVARLRDGYVRVGRDSHKAASTPA